MFLEIALKTFSIEQNKKYELQLIESFKSILETIDNFLYNNSYYRNRIMYTTDILLENIYCKLNSPNSESIFYPILFIRIPRHIKKSELNQYILNAILESTQCEFSNSDTTNFINDIEDIISAFKFGKLFNEYHYEDVNNE